MILPFSTRLFPLELPRKIRRSLGAAFKLLTNILFGLDECNQIFEISKPVYLHYMT